VGGLKVNDNTECRCTENECPRCHEVTASYFPGPTSDHQTTNRLCVDCRCWTDYWEDRCDRPMQMTEQEAIDTYDENQERAGRKRDRNEGRD